MARKRNKWTSKEIIKGKTLPFIVMTVFFTYIINVLANRSLTYLLNIGSTSTWTHIYGFGVLGIIFAIPAAFISIFIIKIGLKIKGTSRPKSNDPLHEYKAEREENQEKQFKWHNIYGIVLGYFFLGFIFNLSKKLTQYIHTTGLQDRPILESNISLLITIACIVITVKVVKTLNKIMIEKTNTNKEVMYDVMEGIYDSDFSNIQQKDRTLKLLEMGKVSSVKSALTYLKTQKWVRNFGIFSLAITSILFLATFGVVNFFAKEAIVTSGRISGGSVGNFSENNRVDKETRNHARWDAEEKKKKANYAQHQANKQAAYNPNTYHIPLSIFFITNCLNRGDSFIGNSCKTFRTSEV